MLSNDNTKLISSLGEQQFRREWATQARRSRNCCGKYEKKRYAAPDG